MKVEAGSMPTGKGRRDDRSGVGTRPEAQRVALLGFLALMLASGMLVPGLATAQHDPDCYAVANPLNNVTLLVRIVKFDFNPATNETVIGNGDTGTEKTDAIALQPDAGVLFGSNSLMGTRPEDQRRGYLGTYDLSTGQFIQHPNPLGYGDGRLGRQNLYDMSGLTFDPATGDLYATHVRSTVGHADLLIRVDIVTGRVVENAFGPNVDYVPMDLLPAYPELDTVEDIAIDPADGQMYAIINNSTVGDRLVKVDTQAGALTDVGPFGVGEVEGMDFDPHGRLWVTAGVTDNSTEWYLFEVDKATGWASNPAASTIATTTKPWPA